MRTARKGKQKPFPGNQPSKRHTQTESNLQKATPKPQSLKTTISRVFVLRKDTPKPGESLFNRCALPRLGREQQAAARRRDHRRRDGHGILAQGHVLRVKADDLALLGMSLVRLETRSKPTDVGHCPWVRTLIGVGWNFKGTFGPSPSLWVN